jgi:hypothetical protein
MKFINSYQLGAATLILAGLSGCLGSSSTSTTTTTGTPPATTTTTAPSASSLTTTTSSSTASGAVGAYVNGGSTYMLAPAASTSGNVNFVNLTSLVNSGITTSLKDSSGAAALISGTSLDPANNIGVAFNYYISKISLFSLATAKEIATYDAQTVNTLSSSGASGVKISGVILDSANQTIILATADGLQMVSYATQTSPTLVKTIASNIANPTTGVEIMENFAFDPNLPAGPMIITGGGYSSGPLMVLVNAKTGATYTPDTATSALFVKSQYIDAAAVDSIYHVAILADESTGTTLVDLNQLTLNATTGKYSLPAAAVKRMTTYSKMDNLGLESTNHLLMMGYGFGGSSMVVAKLSNPSVSLGFTQEVTLSMPTGADNTGASVYWSGGKDPHTAGAYLDASNASMAVWLNGNGTHTAIIDLQKVLSGALANSTSYAPLTTKDITYFKMP